MAALAVAACGWCSQVRDQPCRGGANGQTVDPSSYDADYQHDVHTNGVPFLGPAMLKDAFFSAVDVASCRRAADSMSRSQGPHSPARPVARRCESPTGMAIPVAVRAVVAEPAGGETFIILVLPVLLILALFLVPLASNRGEQASLEVVDPGGAAGGRDLRGTGRSRRIKARTAPWSPQMTAWSGEPGTRRPDSRRYARATARRDACFNARTVATATPWKVLAGNANRDLASVGGSGLTTADPDHRSDQQRQHRAVETCRPMASKSRRKR